MCTDHIFIALENRRSSGRWDVKQPFSLCSGHVRIHTAVLFMTNFGCVFTLKHCVSLVGQAFTVNCSGKKKAFAVAALNWLPARSLEEEGGYSADYILVLYWRKSST